MRRRTVLVVVAALIAGGLVLLLLRDDAAHVDRPIGVVRPDLDERARAARAVRAPGSGGESAAQRIAQMESSLTSMLRARGLDGADLETFEVLRGPARSLARARAAGDEEAAKRAVVELQLALRTIPALEPEQAPR